MEDRQHHEDRIPARNGYGNSEEVHGRKHRRAVLVVWYILGTDLVHFCIKYRFQSENIAFINERKKRAETL